MAAGTPDIVLYTSLVSGSTLVNKQSEAIRNLFHIKKIEYKEVDISVDEDAKKQMWAQANGERKLPQIHVNGVGKGGWDDLNEANECETINEFLSLG